MTIPHFVTTELTIVQEQDGRIWRARLPNGRPVIAFRLHDEPPLDLKPGDTALARLSVCDFSQAHLLQPCFGPAITAPSYPPTS